MARRWIFVILLVLCGPVWAQHTAADIQTRYFATPSACGPNPAYFCSGVILRGTQVSPNGAYHTWNPSPASVRDGGVSFSYLRQDAKFDKLALNYFNGVIMYPPGQTPPGKTQINYLCFFPMDAATNNRQQDGCGQSSLAGAGQGSGPCEYTTVNVWSGQQWVQRYGNRGSQSGFYGCAFIVDPRNPARDGAAAAFASGLQAIGLLGNVAFQEQNELRAETWPQNIGKTLPMEAFFYLNGSQPGFLAAKLDQQDLYRTDGVWLPIVNLRLPSSLSDHASFHYYPSDQAIPAPPGS